MLSDSTMFNEICERKPTRPTILIPTPRPVTKEVAASGSRKLPQPTHLPAQPRKRDLILETGLDLSEELTTNPCSTSMTTVEQDLHLSEDDDVPIHPPKPKRRTTILLPIRPRSYYQVCKHVFVKGPKKGQTCGKLSGNEQNLCGIHLVQSSKKHIVSENPSNITRSYEELKLKIEKLEKIVDDLTDKNHVVCHPEKPSTSEPSTEKNDKKRSRRLIQNIRIYKLDPSETYKLLRYQDGMPIVESKKKLYKVCLPNYMKRPIPNGKWALVCDSEMPKMVWKEV